MRELTGSKYGFGGDYHEVYYQVLAEDKEEGGIDLEQIMSGIQDFLEAAFGLGINPLRDLRQILPQYRWQYHMCVRKEVATLVKDADLIWRVDWLDESPESIEAQDLRFVTATPFSHAKPRHYFWAGTISVGKTTTKKVEFAEQHGGEPVCYQMVN